jgi:Uma2 family endonuclease
MIVSERTYEEIVQANPGRKLELHDGQIREKPIMTIGHNRLESALYADLYIQLRGGAFEVRMGQAPVRRSERNYYLPDVYVVPRHPRTTPLDTFEVFRDPLPFVAEVWSPSTGDYDVDEKIPEYRARGDLEIWRLHPFERSVTAWRPQPDVTYAETTLRSGTVALHALPSVLIDLDALFDLD